MERIKTSATSPKNVDHKHVSTGDAAGPSGITPNPLDLAPLVAAMPIDNQNVPSNEGTWTFISRTSSKRRNRHDKKRLQQQNRAEQQARPNNVNNPNNNSGACSSGQPIESVAGPSSAPSKPIAPVKQTVDRSSEQLRATEVGSNSSSDLVRYRPPLASSSKQSVNTEPPAPPKKRKRKKHPPLGGTGMIPHSDPRALAHEATLKRDRLDDTISPRGDTKRTRTTERPRVTNDLSYARAAQQPNLSVAIALSPRGLLTGEEADQIKATLTKKIFAAYTDPLRPGQTRYAPAFRGNSFLNRGVLMMWCEEDRALTWLKAAVEDMSSPRAGTTLKVVRQIDLPDLVKAVLFVPDYTGDVGTLHGMLALQNYWYDMYSWALYHASVRTHHFDTGDKTGLYLVLGIPRSEVTKLQERDRRVAYTVGCIYIRYVTPDGLSTEPPPEPDREEMCVEDGATGPVPQPRDEPIPSTSTADPSSLASSTGYSTPMEFEAMLPWDALNIRAQSESKSDPSSAAESDYLRSPDH